MRAKNYNLEIIRVISFIFVITVHVANYYCKSFPEISTGEYVFSLTANVIARICVPCFFMISGVLLLGKQEPIKKNLKRAGRYFLILLFWSAVYLLFNRYCAEGQPIVPVTKLLNVQAEKHLWYLYVLIPIYFAIPFMQVLVANMKKQHEVALLIIGAIAVVCSFVFDSSYLEVPLFGGKAHCVYFFYLGYYLNKYKNRIPLKNGHLALLFLGSSFLNIVIGMAKSLQMEGYWKMTTEYKNPLLVVSSAAFFLILLRLAKGEISLSGKARKWVDTLCTCSFGIYLSHILFLNLYMEYVPSTKVPSYMGIPLVTVGIAIISFLFIYIIRKIPGGKWLT